jgi:hypothetical protein
VVADHVAKETARRGRRSREGEGEGEKVRDNSPDDQCHDRGYRSSLRAVLED